MGGSRDSGLFGPGSIVWRVNREGSLLIGGGAAAILQVAHPLVAAGVGEHSRYREDPWGRLQRTLDLTTKIVFGSTRTATKASRAIQMAHKRVNGELPWDAGRFPKGTPYDANDPELQMWVHATLVATSLTVYTRWVGPLSVADQRRYYEEHNDLKRQLGSLQQKHYLTPEEEVEKKRLQKLKLAGKDKIMQILARHRGH